MRPSQELLRAAVAAGFASLLVAAGCTPSDRDRAERKADQTAQQVESGARQARDAAVDTAQKVSKEVTAAASTASDEVSDMGLELKVKAALLDKLGVDGLRVSVDAAGGKVALGGEVKAKATAELASEVAKSVSGVTAVEEHIAVSPTGAPSTKVDQAIDKTQSEVADAMLETKVKARLLEEMGKNAFDIEVEATDGVVSLSGSVPDKIRRDLAVQTAGKTAGVTKVVDLLKAAA